MVETQLSVCIDLSMTFSSRCSYSQSLYRLFLPHLTSSQSKSQSKLITRQTPQQSPPSIFQHLLLLALLNLLRHPPKQRLTLALPPIRLRIRHNPPLPFPNLPNPPRPLIARLLKELQILIEAPAARLRHVHVRPDARKQIRSSEDGEELVGEVVEENRG